MCTIYKSLFLILIITNFLFCQATWKDKPIELQTKIEAFLASKGKIIVKDFYDIDNITGISGTWTELKVLVVYEPDREATKVKGLRIEIHQDQSHEHISFLDYDEVLSFAKAVQYISDLSNQWRITSKPYTEVIFSTKNEFEFGFYQKQLEQTFFMKSGEVIEAQCFFVKNDLLKMRAIVDEAIKILKVK